MKVSEFQTPEAPPLPSSLAPDSLIETYIADVFGAANRLAKILDDERPGESQGLFRQQRMFRGRVLGYPLIELSIYIPTYYDFKLETDNPRMLTAAELYALIPSTGQSVIDNTESINDDFVFANS